MFLSISKGVNQLHRMALNQAIHRQNTSSENNRDTPHVTVLVGTKNIVMNIITAIFSRDIIVLYFTGLGRLYTDYGIIGRCVFAIMVILSGLRKNRRFIVENGYDRRVIEYWTRRSVHQINGSGFNASLYKNRKNDTDAGGKVIGHMSRFGSSKCTDEILKLIHSLPDDYTFIIAGKDISHSHYADLFYQLSKTHANVEMLGFLETPEEVSSFFRRIDVFLYPSVREGLPITLLESAYHRVPFLTTNVAGCIDISNRFGFPACAPEDFGVQDNHLNIDNWGVWSSRWDDILKDYSVENVQDQFEQIFKVITQQYHELNDNRMSENI